MAGLLVLLGPAGRVGARLRPRAPWLLGAATSCAPPLWALALARPGPDARLLHTARRDCLSRQRVNVIGDSVLAGIWYIMPPPATAVIGEPNRITEPGSSANSTEKKLSRSQQLKKVFQEYGAVGVGIDMSAILLKLGFKESLVQSKMAAGTSTFVVAYAIHKLFAPVRISITLVSVPFIVRYFRRVGLFKPPATKP
ncbi:hypothetical protein A6R68_10192 [Neotoma lepida]|uniref:DUF1279 domain-containing protein n=1 Tax=Neotoma lepida TaxID=56216 RepID=A0A1A6FYN2_NEOLE|nr:hypothetical protein A6R68_10192 [Neotoma lepida]